MCDYRYHDRVACFNVSNISYDLGQAIIRALVRRPYEPVISDKSRIGKVKESVVVEKFRSLLVDKYRQSVGVYLQVSVFGGLNDKGEFYMLADSKGPYITVSGRIDAIMTVNANTDYRENVPIWAVAKEIQSGEKIFLLEIKTIFTNHPMGIVNIHDIFQIYVYANLLKLYGVKNVYPYLVYAVCGTSDCDSLADMLSFRVDSYFSTPYYKDLLIKAYNNALMLWKASIPIDLWNKFRKVLPEVTDEIPVSQLVEFMRAYYSDNATPTFLGMTWHHDKKDEYIMRIFYKILETLLYTNFQI